MSTVDEKPIKENTIERSKTSRASCKDCRGIIAKGEPRFCLVDFAFSEHGSYKYYHLACAQRRKPQELAELLRTKGDELEVPRAEIEAAIGRDTPATAGSTATTPASPPAIAPSPDWLIAAKGMKSEQIPDFVREEAAPRTKEGLSLDEAAVGKLVVAMKAHSETTPSATLASFDEWLDEASFRDFSWRIFERWARAGAHMKDKWLFRNLVRTLDDASALRLGSIIEGWLRAGKRNSGEAALELLESRGTPSALLVIQALAQRFHYKGDANLAALSLSRVAEKRGMKREDLEDWLVPTLGLDENGSRIFDYGPRSFRLQVSSELRVEVVAEESDAAAGQQKVLHGLPPPRKTDDLAKVDAARRAYEHLRAELEKTLRVQSTRLEHALASGRLWEGATWDKQLRRHPVLKHLVRRLVWASFVGDENRPHETFIVDESGDLMNVQLAKVELDVEETRIGLVHPAELDASTRAAWIGVLADFLIVQPFTQLGRAVRDIPAGDAGTDRLTDYPKHPIAPGPLHNVLNRAGWIKGVPDDMRVMYFHKRFDSQNVTAVLCLDPGLWVTGAEDELQTPSEAYFIREKSVGFFEPDRIPLVEVGIIALSEVLFDLDALASAAN